MLKKFIKIAIFIILVALVSGGSTYLLMNKKKAQVSVEPLHSPLSAIAVGKPCDARDLKSYNGGGAVANTKGLQCYMYDDLSAYPLMSGQWTYPSKPRDRQGVWMYPNHMSKPIFLAEEKSPLFYLSMLSDVTKNWKSYHNPVGEYSFKYPSQWNVIHDPHSPNQLTIQQLSPESAGVAAGLPLQLSITYHPHAKFEDTEEFKTVAEAPDDWLVADTSTDTFVYTRHFELNGTPALMVQTMDNFDLGASPYQVAIYVARPDSYITVAYTKYQGWETDLPAEMVIKTLGFK